MKSRFILLVCLSAILNAFTSCTEKPSTDLKVMSFNIRLSPSDDFDGENCWLNRREACIEMIQDVRPDLIGIQEGIFHQVNYMDDNLPGYGRYGVGRDDGLDRGEANAIFYNKKRFDLLEEGTFWLSVTPDTVSRGWDGACNRIVTWARLADKLRGSQEVWFFNTHLDHVGKVARDESGKLIIERMKALVPEGAAIFLTGDFNANFDDPILEPIKGYLQMSRETAPVTDWLNTYHGWNAIGPDAGGSVIDHVFHRGAKALEYHTWTANYNTPCISDHYPVYAIFSFE